MARVWEAVLLGATTRRLLVTVPAHPFGARQMALERLPSAIGFAVRIKVQHYSCNVAPVRTHCVRVARCWRHLDQAAAFSSTVSRGLFLERFLNPLHGRRKFNGTAAPKKMDGMALVAHQAPVDDVLVAADAKAAAMRHRAFVGELPPEKVRDAHHSLP
jgi:hypothetical protein